MITFYFSNLQMKLRLIEFSNNCQTFAKNTVFTKIAIFIDEIALQMEVSGGLKINPVTPMCPQLRNPPTHLILSPTRGSNAALPGTLTAKSPAVDMYLTISVSPTPE